MDNDEFCRAGLYAEDNQPISVGDVGSAGALVYYGKDKYNCPYTGPRCQRVRLPSGGRLLIGRRRGSFACIYFPKRRNSITGWVKADNIKVQPFDHDPSPSAWVGLWTQDSYPVGDPYVRFRLRNGVLRVKGQSWTVSPWDHVGGLDEPLRLIGYKAYDADCKVTFWLIGEILIASDLSDPCAGSGAKFGGVYMRDRRK